MSHTQASNMEVDHDHDSPSSGGLSSGGTLKRSNSAPMINMMVAPTQTVEVSSSSSFKVSDASRLRRLSSSNMSIHSASNTSSIVPPPKPTDRVNQIKHEENNITDRETAHEKVVHHSWQVTNSWDVLSLNNPDPQMSEAHRRPRSFSESLHIMTSPSLLCGSHSPTRITKQCFSPSMRAPVKDTTFTPSPSPSPTRKSFIRSLSPIATLAVPLKRKLESDGGERFDYMSPPKKFHTGPSTPDRNLPHPLAQSISSSSLEESSPEQTVPGSCLPPQAPPVTAPSTHHSHPHQHAQQLHVEQPAFIPMGELSDIHMADSNDSFPSSSQQGQFTPIHPDRV